jgi:hypothetical protein
MSCEKVPGQAVSYSYCDKKIQTKQCEVREVVLRQRFFIKMSMYEPEPPQSLSPKRIILQSWDKDSPCVSDYNVSNIAGTVDQNTYLTADFKREFSQISRQFGSDDFAVNLSSVYPFERFEVAGP